MSVSDTDRITALERAFNQLQLSINNLATKRAVNSIPAVIQPQIDNLQSEIEQIKNISGAEDLDTHEIDPDAHPQLNSRYTSIYETNVVSGVLQGEIAAANNKISRAVYIEDFGAIGNGIADDTSAFQAFNTWATSLTNAAITLECSPDKTYMIADPYWPCNIPNLIVNGHGSKFQNNATINAMKSLLNPCYGLSSTPGTYTSVDRYLIDSTTIGTNSITTSTPANAGNFSVGEMIMIGSFDLTFAGAPPCFRYFEFHIIKSTDITTGFITLEDQVIHKHLSNFPYSTSDSRCDGRANVYKIEQGSLFNIRHVYNDIEFILNITDGAGAITESPYAMGYNITFNRCVAHTGTYASGFLPSVSEHLTFNQCVNEGDCEVDKLITHLDFNDCDIWGTIEAATSVRNFNARNTRFGNGYNIIPQNLNLENCDVTGDAEFYSGAYGALDTVNIIGGTHKSLPSYSIVAGQSATLSTVSGFWSAPTLTLNLNIPAHQYFTAKAYPGKFVFVTETDQGLAIPTGVFGKIASVTGSLDTAVIEIEFSQALIGTEQLTIYLEPSQVNIENVKIADQVVNQNWIMLAKKKRYYWNPLPTSASSLQNELTCGMPTSLTVNVLRPYTGVTGGNILLDVSSLYPHYLTSLHRTVDLRTAGKRQSNLLGNTGWSGNNGESAGATISGGQFKNAIMGIYAIFFPSTIISGTIQDPIVEMELEFDCPFGK